MRQLVHSLREIKPKSKVVYKCFVQDSGFQKLHVSQHCLVKMLENWKNTLDKSDSVCALFKNLSKAFVNNMYDL